MRYHALATDYDGTLAHNGIVADEIISSLKKFKESGRKLILVTGRELDDLKRVFDHFQLFDRVVAENGALLYRPATIEEVPLGDAPPESFIAALKEKKVNPLSVGRVIVATWEPNEQKVLDTIKELSLERQVIFNKGAVMVLPSGINKAFGLAAALKELNLSPHNVVAVGDAENDNALLEACECSAVVSNALPLLKEKADIVTIADHGWGVMELIDRILATDLKEIKEKQGRLMLSLGTTTENKEVKIHPYGQSILLAGTSGGGKSTLTTAFVEQLAGAGYQFCLIDPEGDYQNLEDAITLGDTSHPPVIEEIVKVLKDAIQSVVICMLAIPYADRASYFIKLFPALMSARAELGHPHWILMDEAHHLLPASWAAGGINLPTELHNCFMITTSPGNLLPAALNKVNLVLAIGENPATTIREFAEKTDQAPPELPEIKLQRGEVVAWMPEKGAPFWMRTNAPKHQQRRHIRKYATGELGADKSFYFKGPEGKLNLRAQNLMLFIQMADGVDEETWQYHLLQKDYSRWFRQDIKDEALAQETEKIESANFTPADSKKQIRKLIEKRYTGPGDSEQ